MILTLRKSKVYTKDQLRNRKWKTPKSKINPTHRDSSTALEGCEAMHSPTEDFLTTETLKIFQIFRTSRQKVLPKVLEMLRKLSFWRVVECVRGGGGGGEIHFYTLLYKPRLFFKMKGFMDILGVPGLLLPVNH